jgi:hypothetical protein
MVVSELQLTRHMLDALLNYLFGCSHERTTFPLTHTAKFGNRQRATYIACLHCGAEFAYDWEHMRVGSPLPTYASVTPVGLECIDEQAVVRFVC